MTEPGYTVTVRKKVLKKLAKAPEAVKILFRQLAQDLKGKGPIQKEWPNYSKLSEKSYHCHLNYRYVACWQHEGDSIEIEVYYAGTRENAPY
ncbi:hypothetical protein [Treponema primitia]|uniref:hypothetical protein n=1 Tax=Treponema primitia TaxID=88058 RepID=UPI0002555060|nr:hypothetical protein [Treponema primitia]